MQDKWIAYCLELPSGLISSSRYVDIEKMNIILSNTKITKNLSDIPEELILQRFLKIFVY